MQEDKKIIIIGESQGGEDAKQRMLETLKRDLSGEIEVFTNDEFSRIGIDFAKQDAFNGEQVFSIIGNPAHGKSMFTENQNNIEILKNRAEALNRFREQQKLALLEKAAFYKEFAEAKNPEIEGFKTLVREELEFVYNKYAKTFTFQLTEPCKASYYVSDFKKMFGDVEGFILDWKNIENKTSKLPASKRLLMINFVNQLSYYLKSKISK